MTRFSFLVAGSGAEPYRVEFARIGDDLVATCTCQAGQMKQSCKHRLSLLAGDASGIAADAPQDLSALLDGLRGSRLAEALVRLTEAEDQADKAKAAAVAARKTVARLMHAASIEPTP